MTAWLVFTTGRLRGSWFGYRSYDTLRSDPGAQVVVVHDEATGRVRAVAIGNELGPRRVGANGAVAADALAPADATAVAIIGSGTQAYTQVWALAAVQDLREVRVYSRDPDRRTSFAERVAPLVGGACHPVENARAACEGAQVVILATSSPTLLVTDSLDQIGAYNPPNVLVGTSQEHRLVSLGAVRAGEVAAAAPDGISLFCSAGLAGTEAFLLDRLTASIENVSQ